MNICMFTNTYLPHVGGVSRSVAIFAEDLRELGHSVMITAPIYPGYEVSDEEEPDIVRVPAIQEFNGSDFSLRIPVPVYIDEKIDEFRPDIIHSHHPYLLGDAALRAAGRRNLPLVFTHHTLYEEYAHYINKDSNVMKRFARELSIQYANLCDRVAAPSASIEELLRSRGVETPISVIPTGVDVPFFSEGDGKAFRKSHQIPENAFVIGHLGRLAPEKNLDFLTEAVVRVVKQTTETCFLVVGEGPSQDGIAEVFSREGLQDRLIAPGAKSGDELSGAYNAMDLFVFSSKSETQGMVLVEAMAAGVPVIALDASGVREVVADGKNGRLLDENADEDIFADAVKTAAADDRQMARWEVKARETADKFSREQCAEALNELYETTIAEMPEKRTHKSHTLEPWESFLLGIRAEWDLLTEKARAMVGTVEKDSGDNGSN